MEVDRAIEEGFVESRPVQLIKATYTAPIDVVAVYSAATTFDASGNIVSFTPNLSFEEDTVGIGVNIHLLDPPPMVAKYVFQVTARDLVSKKVFAHTFSWDVNRGDVNSSGDVTVQDLAYLLSSFGTPVDPGLPDSVASDIDLSSMISLQDLANVLTNFGTSLSALPEPQI
jgi:hypothetical protein